MKYGAIFGWIMKIGIVGYGNLGKALEKIAVETNTEIVGIFTRREPCKVISPYKSKMYSFVDVCDFAGAIDVLLLCVGSKSDLAGVAEQVANKFNTVDSFDTHAKIPVYADFMRRTVTDKLSYISIGWDPGLFSLMRALFSAILPSGEPSTFWGKGVSQGHGEAIRRIKGVKNAVQYTIPKQSAIDAVMSGQGKNLSERDKHLRQCFVVLEDGANGDEIEKTIKNMPYYFDGYDTSVHFVSQAEFEKEHTGMAHGGFVLEKGEICGYDCDLQFRLQAKSNPHFTASVLIAYAKSCVKEYQNGERGVKSVLDVPIASLLDGKAIDNVRRFV